MSVLFCNGQLADAGALSAALVNYGHFTSLQVRGGAVQGWALHLARLQQGTRELFDVELDGVQLVAWLRQALLQLDAADASVRITVFSRQFDFRQPLRAAPVDVLIAIAAPATIPALARSVLPMPYQRELAHIKHVGTFPLFQLRRQAMQSGFDDALFVDAQDRISEGSTWNLAFWDGTQVHWPQASALRGCTERLLMDGLTSLAQMQVQGEVTLSALARFSGAVAFNASGIWPLAAVGEQRFEQSDQLLAKLQAALAQTPWLAL
ncbi:MAG: aminotransferase class IV [Stenotrophomonas sp.]